jgi:hypothetical protein
VHERLLQDEEGSFDTAEWSDELTAATTNHAIGTRLLLDNDHVTIFELRLDAGERAPFHIHDKPYFWTVVDAGRGRQRSADGSWTIHEYRLGETAYKNPTPEDPLIHDLENVGESTLRFVTVELKH